MSNKSALSKEEFGLVPTLHAPLSQLKSPLILLLSVIKHPTLTHWKQSSMPSSPAAPSNFLSIASPSSALNKPSKQDQQETSTCPTHFYPPVHQTPTTIPLPPSTPSAAILNSFKPSSTQLSMVLGASMTSQTSLRLLNTTKYPSPSPTTWMNRSHSSSRASVSPSS